MELDLLESRLFRVLDIDGDLDNILEADTLVRLDPDLDLIHIPGEEELPRLSSTLLDSGLLLRPRSFRLFGDLPREAWYPLSLPVGVEDLEVFLLSGVADLYLFLFLFRACGT